MFALRPLERESSQIESTAYDHVQAVMRVKFHRGGLYDYQNTTAEQHQRVRDEGGAYLDAEFKKKPTEHPFSKVS